MAKTGSKLTKQYIRMDVPQLVERAKAGEQMAFTFLFERYHNQLTDYLKRQSGTLLKNKSVEIEDICLDTFNKAFLNIGSYDPKYMFTTWLYKIAKNSLTDYFRQTGNESNSSTESSEVRNVHSGDTPEDKLIENQQIEKTMEAIRQLPDIYKDVMMLYIEGYALDDIADSLSITLSNAKVRVKRGKDLLADKLSDSPIAQKRANSKKTK